MLLRFIKIYKVVWKFMIIYEYFWWFKMINENFIWIHNNLHECYLNATLILIVFIKIYLDYDDFNINSENLRLNIWMYFNLEKCSWTFLCLV